MNKIWLLKKIFELIKSVTKRESVESSEKLVRKFMDRLRPVINGRDMEKLVGLCSVEYICECIYSEEFNLANYYIRILIEKLAKNVRDSSVCGLGQSAPNPVLSTLKYFRDEYEEHVKDKHCRSKECKKLARIEIIAEQCKGCGLCQKNCPVGAIEGEDRDVRTINQEKCIKCGTCLAKCPFKAIQ